MKTLLRLFEDMLARIIKHFLRSIKATAIGLFQFPEDVHIVYCVLIGTHFQWEESRPSRTDDDDISLVIHYEEQMLTDAFCLHVASRLKIKKPFWEEKK